MKKILVTGGAGFIGSHLCTHLIESGAQVICMDNFSTGSKENIRPLVSKKNFTFMEVDINDPSVLRNINNIDEIYHLACPASPKKYQADPIGTLKTSFIGSNNILELGLRNNSRVLLSSTSEIYGDPLVHPQNESYWGNVNPIGIRACYNEGKRCAETLFMDYHRAHGLETRIVRIFNTYGPGMQFDDGRVVSNFINQALNNMPITIYGSGSQTRSLQYIDDLVRGLLAMMKSKYYGPINLGSTNELTILEIAHQILNLIPESKSKIIHIPLPQDDPVKRRPDVHLAKSVLGWEATTSTLNGLEKTIAFYKK